MWLIIHRTHTHTHTDTRIMFHFAIFFVLTADANLNLLRSRQIGVPTLMPPPVRLSIRVILSEANYDINKTLADAHTHTDTQKRIQKHMHREQSKNAGNTKQATQQKKTKPTIVKCACERKRFARNA